MTFKDLYANIKEHLDRCVEGKKTTFTHRAYRGYEFQIVAKKKEVK